MRNCIYCNDSDKDKPFASPNVCRVCKNERERIRHAEQGRKDRRQKEVDAALNKLIRISW